MVEDGKNTWGQGYFHYVVLKPALSKINNKLWKKMSQSSRRDKSLRLKKIKHLYERLLKIIDEIKTMPKTPITNTWLVVIFETAHAVAVEAYVALTSGRWEI